MVMISTEKLYKLLRDMEIDKVELHRLYMEWVNQVSDECDWKTHFGPEEIVYAIVDILKKNPTLITKK